MARRPEPHELSPLLREQVTAIVARAAKRAAERMDEFEFRTYLVSARSPADVTGATDDEVAGARVAIRREMRAQLAELWPHREYSPQHPEMVIDVRPRDGGEIWFDPMPLFVAGRYRKLARGLSQTVFYCPACRGGRRRSANACKECEGSGRLYPEAVEDFVGPVIADAVGGRKPTFHGAGREDVDVMMLGDGRPFVVSVEAPRRRSFDEAGAAESVAHVSGGRVDALELRVVTRADMSRITGGHGAKTYRVVVRPAEDARFPEDAEARLIELSGAVLEQRTPQRVERRRADKVRERTVRELRVVSAAADEIVVEIRTDPGLYVKEFVSSDAGRTTPSIAAHLGVPAVCAELDVLAVE